MDEIDRLLLRVKGLAHGWMPLPVYRRLYETAAKSGGGTIVEIGTFRGAATVALALGAKSANESFRILTADILTSPRGLPGASVDAKIAALRAMLDSFGVADAVAFIHGTCEELVAKHDPRNIRLLLLDGGGRIEADLALLWDRLSNDATLVVDDIDGRITVERSWRSVKVNQKHRISKLLADRFVDAAMLVPIGRTASTGWFRKGEATPSAGEIRLMAMPAYHQLIHLSVHGSEFGLPRALLRRIAARAPWLRSLYRRVRPVR